MTYLKLFARVAAALGALLVGSATQAVGGPVAASAAKEARSLTVCADPDSLPLSSSAGQPAGYDLEFAEEIARNLGAQLKVHWYASEYIGRVYRQLVAGNCDFFVGAPTDKRVEGANPQVVLSRPYLTAGFVVVVGPQVTAKTLDELKGRRIGVQMNTMADFQVFELGFDRGLYHRQKDIFKALESGEVQAAVMWGPVFGWLAKNQPAAKLRVLADARAEFAFPLAVAVRKDDPELLAEINRAIEGLGKSGRRDEILARYGFPAVFATPVSARPAVGDRTAARVGPATTAAAKRGLTHGGAVAITVPLHFVVGGARPASAETQPTAMPSSSPGGWCPI
jgi:glutamine transport system substrate-binding protein